MYTKIIGLIASVIAASPAFAEEAAGMAAPMMGMNHSGGMIALAAGLGLGLAALGCGMAQGKIGAAAMDGIARNPQAQNKMFVPMILALVFVETLLLLTWIVAGNLVKLVH